MDKYTLYKLSHRERLDNVGISFNSCEHTTSAAKFLSGNYSITRIPTSQQKQNNAFANVCGCRVDVP